MDTVIINNYGKNAQFSVIKMPSELNSLDFALWPLCCFFLCKEVYSIKSCIMCTLSVQKKFTFQVLVVSLVFILQRQQRLWAKCRVRTAVEATFFCCCCSHSNILKIRLKGNVGTVFWKYFWEPCIPGELKNLIVRWRGGWWSYEHFSPSPTLSLVSKLKKKITERVAVLLQCLASSWGRKGTSLVNNEMVLSCTGKKQNKTTTIQCTILAKCLWVSSCGIFTSVLCRDFIFSFLLTESWGIRWNGCTAKNFILFFSAMANQLTNTEMGSRNLSIWGYLRVLVSAQSGTKSETLNSLVQHFLCLCCLPFERNH